MGNVGGMGQQVWTALCHQAGIAAAPGTSLWNSLSHLYLAPTRYYHNLNHILTCLHTAEPYLAETEDPIAVQLAIWFHDAIYDTHAHDNEAQSAFLAASGLSAADVALPQVQEVQRLILATASHRAEMKDANACLLLDADLAILGAAADEYQRYAQAIRQEYEWVDEENYRQGRGRVLEQFLQRERIYQTRPLYEQLEASARANIRRELDQLRGPLRK